MKAKKGPIKRKVEPRATTAEIPNPFDTPFGHAIRAIADRVSTLERAVFALRLRESLAVKAAETRGKITQKLVDLVSQAHLDESDRWSLHHSAHPDWRERGWNVLRDGKSMEGPFGESKTAMEFMVKRRGDAAARAVLLALKFTE